MTTYMILEVSLDGIWTLPFGLSQSHGHGSWLVCEVALTLKPICLGDGMEAEKYLSAGGVGPPGVEWNGKSENRNLREGGG